MNSYFNTVSCARRELCIEVFRYLDSDIRKSILGLSFQGISKVCGVLLPHKTYVVLCDVTFKGSFVLSKATTTLSKSFAFNS